MQGVSDGCDGHHLGMMMHLIKSQSASGKGAIWNLARLGVPSTHRFKTQLFK